MGYTILRMSGDTLTAAQELRAQAADANAAGHALDVLDGTVWRPVSGFVHRDPTMPLEITRDNRAVYFFGRETFRYATEEERCERVRLFEPAPVQLEGQTSLL